MIDFTNCTEKINKFRGSEKKKTIEYNGKTYLLKFPDPTREKGKSISYINNTISEYIGCKIYESAGIETQNVILGTYVNDSGVSKIVCACEDFEKEDMKLYEFKNISLSDVEEHIPKNLDLYQVLDTIDNSSLIKNKQVVRDRFWDMFVVDTFIGNKDRHLGNWGFLGNEEKGIIDLAPVYDCGSCLFPLLSENEILNMPVVEYKNQALNVYSCYRIEGKKINATQYILSGENEECNEALNRIMPNLQMDKVNEIIDNIEVISEGKKNFYKSILEIRYRDILNKEYEKLYLENAMKQCMKRTAARTPERKLDKELDR